MRPAMVELYDLRGNRIYTHDVGARRASTDIAMDSETGDARIATTNRTFIWTPDESISSGIYLVRARTQDGRTVSKKLVYLR